MIKRMRIAWRFMVWPWRIPVEAVRHLSLEPLTQADIDRTVELSSAMGWRREGDE